MPIETRQDKETVSMKNWFLGLMVLALPSLALAQDAGIPDDLGGLVTGTAEAVKGGHWSMVVALAIMILVFFATKVPLVKSRLPSAARPWVAAVAGVLAVVAATVYTSGDWMSAVLQGLVTGAAASGFWELVGKQFLKPAASDTPAGE
jgi:hypothetical protein